MLLAYPPCPPSKEPAQTKGWFLFFSWMPMLCFPETTIRENLRRLEETESG
jgi:hypothetical protein